MDLQLTRKQMMGPDSAKWLGAMRSEIDSIYENQVWNLVVPTEGIMPTNVYGSITDIDVYIHEA